MQNAIFHTLTYDVETLVPYINWLYYFHAWGLTSAQAGECERVKADALALAAQWQGSYEARSRFAILPAGSDGDDLLVGSERLPMLRQQRPSRTGEPCLCLADFVRPACNGLHDRVGVFCTTMDGAAVASCKGDDYQALVAQMLADRLAEAATEKMHEEVRRHYWGYAPTEELTPEQRLREEYQGIRPAVGYPSLPDTSINFLIDRLIDMGKIGVSLTETGMMQPHASVSGLMIAHPQSRYFELGPVGEDQLADYACRRGITIDYARRFIASSLIKR